jgi:hypothetical protein
VLCDKGRTRERGVLIIFVSEMTNGRLFLAQQPLEGQGFLIIKASPSPLETPYTVALLWMSYQPDAETST